MIMGRIKDIIYAGSLSSTRGGGALFLETARPYYLFPATHEGVPESTVLSVNQVAVLTRSGDRNFSSKLTIDQADPTPSRLVVAGRAGNNSLPSLHFWSHVP